jgi:hypothetical protein
MVLSLTSPATSGADRVIGDAELGSGGIITATCRGIVIAVGPGHSHFDRW